LEKFREKVRKQHEILTRENEKLARKLEQVLRAQGNSSSIVQKQATDFVIDEPIKTLPKIDPKNTNNNISNSNNSSNNNFNNNYVVLAPVEQQPVAGVQTSPRKTSPRKNISTSNSSFEINEAETIE